MVLLIHIHTYAFNVTLDVNVHEKVHHLFFFVFESFCSWVDHVCSRRKERLSSDEVYEEQYRVSVSSSVEVLSTQNRRGSENSASQPK